MTRRWAYIETSMLRILVEEWESSFDWIVVMDIEGRFLLMDEAGQVEDSMIGRVLVREDGNEIKVVDVEVMDGIEEVRM